MTSVILIADKHGNPVGGVPVDAPRAVRANARSILADRLSIGRHGTQFGGNRDYYEILGYPLNPELKDYLGKFDRDPLGGRIVEFPPEETWRDTPTVKDGKDKDAEEDTKFCNAWSDFAESRRVYHYCQRVDTLAGIGHFGVLLIGVAGSDELKTEVKRVRGIEDVIYLRPYGEQSVTVKEFQTNPSNPRFGLPHMYSIATADMAGGNINPSSTRSTDVHWSRVIHVAEGLLENEVYGRPRLQRVINLLDDVLKVVGGSAEATWKLIRKGFVLNADDPEAEFKSEDKAAIEEQFDEYDHGLRRLMLTRGLTPHDLGSETVDPSGIFDVIMTLISVATRIPKRILMGSERGELASTQDASTWAGYVASRQLNFAEAVILRPLIDRLIQWKALPEPKNKRYTVVWDPLFELTDKEKAEIGKIWAEALEKAASALGAPAATVEEFRGEFTPFAAKLPGGANPPMPDGGRDVLERVADVVANHGYGAKDAKAVVLAAARYLTQAD